MKMKLKIILSIVIVSLILSIATIVSASGSIVNLGNSTGNANTADPNATAENETANEIVPTNTAGRNTSGGLVVNTSSNPVNEPITTGTPSNSTPTINTETPVINTTPRNNTANLQNTNIPQTGQEDVFIVMGAVVLLVGISVISYRKINNFNK